MCWSQNRNTSCFRLHSIGGVPRQALGKDTPQLRKLAAAAPTLTDLAPTILAEFGIEKTEEMVGQSVFQGEPAAPSNN